MANVSLPPLTRTNSACVSPRNQIVTDVFNMFDTDGSGEIELDEIAKAFKTTGKLTDHTRAQLEAHFDFMDSDGSGEVTIDEFRAALGHGEIAFHNYQHQQAYHALGLTLCQNLVVYRRHVLHQEFEKMKQQSSANAVGGLQEQFDCLVRALVMSTFALNLKPPPAGLPSDDGGGGGGGTGGGARAVVLGKGEEDKGGKRRGGSKRCNHSSSSSSIFERTGSTREDKLREREARVLARALMVGQRRNQLGPLPASRLRHLRAELLADVKAAKMSRTGKEREKGIWTTTPHRRVLKKLPPRIAHKMPHERAQSHGPAVPVAF